MHSWLRNIRFSFVILFHLCLAYAHFSVGCYSKSNYCCYCSLLPCIVLFFLLFSPFVWFYAYSKSITMPSTMVYRITLAMPFLNLANIINVWLFKTKQHPQQQHQPMRKKEQYRRAHGERRNRDQTEPNNSPRLCNNYTWRIDNFLVDLVCVSGFNGFFFSLACFFLNVALNVELKSKLLSASSEWCFHFGMNLMEYCDVKWMMPPPTFCIWMENPNGKLFKWNPSRFMFATNWLIVLRLREIVAKHSFRFNCVLSRWFFEMPRRKKGSSSQWYPSHSTHLDV